MSEEQEGKSAIDSGAASAALLRGEWPDLYALLGVAPGADVETLRKRIRESYVEATTNADHRNIARRIHFQTMAEQVLPQCHRILLDEKARAAYDEQSRLHRAGDAAAREYSSFVANTVGDEKTSRDQNDSMILGSAAPSPQDSHAQEMEAARALLESLGRGSAPRETVQPRETAPDNSQNREDAQLRARFSETEDAPQNELASRPPAAPPQTETTPQHDQSPNDNIAARLEARIAPPESNADLASVSTTENATTGNVGTSAAPESAPPEPDATRERIPERIRRELKNQKPAAAPSPEADLLLPLSQSTASESTASQNAVSKNTASTREAAPVAETDAAARAAEAKRAADVRLKNEIEARRNARRAQNSEAAAASTRSFETPRDTSVTPNITPAAAAFNAAESAAGAAEIAADANAPGSDDFTVAPEFRSEKIGVDATQLPSIEPAEVLPTFETPGASTRDANESDATPSSIARDFDDAPADARTARTIFAPRVSLGENADSRRAAGAKTPAKRILSAAARNIFVGLIGGALASFILWRSQQNAAPVLVPLNITCASELYPFLQRAESAFEASPAGAGVDVNLSPVDARDAMSALLDPKTAPPAAWIPSETLWSDRYNKVAGKSGRPPIRVARPLALSPLVLLARGDQAKTLRQKFPTHSIASWQALQSAVQSSAAGHFGLTDPIKSASGGIARLFMAQEWCAKNGVECNEKTLADPRLWKWLSNFENAVPSYGKLTGDMAKTLALGTADRYWWALVYESDAISWMKQKKDLEVFYLPVSNFADHPFCRLGASDAGKRDEFEKFLRAPSMQKALLESGFRPADSELSTGGADNPFGSADLKKRGLKVKGFRIDDRINYRLLNALNAQWAKRYKS